MILVIKTSIVISLLSILALYLLRFLVNKYLRESIAVSAQTTVTALLCLCIGQVYAAFAALAAATTYFASKRSIAAGIASFVIVTMPAITITIMAGSLQLIHISSETAITFGLLVASFGWPRRAGPSNPMRDLPAYLIIVLLTFIGARDTTITNILRLIIENLILYVLPYMLVRKSLGDAISIRNMFLLITAAGLCLATVALFESIRVWPIYQAYGQQFGTMTLANVKMRGGMLRAGGPLMNPPVSGALLALCFVTAFAARDLFQTAMGHRIVLAVLAAGLFAMQARGAWLGAVCGTIGVMVSRRGVSGMMSYAAALSLAGISVYGAALASPRLANLVGFSSDAKNSNEYRDQLNDLGWQIVKAHPLIGQSSDVVQLQMASLRQGEGIVDFVNGYLGIALFSGAIGLALFIGAFILHGYQSYASKRLARARGGGSFTDLGLGVVAAAGSMFPFIPPDYRIVLTIMLLFALSNAVVMRSHIRPGMPGPQPAPARRGEPDMAGASAA